MFKELWYLIKLLFSPMTDLIEVKLMKYFPFLGYSAMWWCGKIITRKSDVNSRTKRHEGVHLKQALFFKNWIAYYWRYLIEWIKGNPIIPPARSAYYTNPFEMEAYGNEDNEKYIVTKNSWKNYKIKNRKQTYKDNEYFWRDYCKLGF